ncbi:RecQ family ATP-dependent DNA helicase [bacterium]|nr:MAG: RecQ family ATP-dependent DNA helicase [bacterium]
MSSELFHQAKEQLRKYWGFDAFRPGQDEVVKSVLSKKDTLVLFPTGGGKSLCFQVPALVWPGLTLVISPLVALMEDQVDALKKRGISATYINSTLSRFEIDQRLINARNGLYKLIYVAPERLGSEVFQGELLNLPLSMVAIDEAHCISEWGHRFRPSYKKIKEYLRPIEQQVAWIALTATATPQVKQDIIESLELKEPTIISKGYVRDNLGYRVENEENKPRRLKELLLRAKGKGAGLIYGSTRKSCETLSELIESVGIKSEPYHAGLSPEDRTRIQKEWIQGKTPWVAVTNAFGMGIDKPDCRFVFHQSPPSSLEAYYQEAGRAGRDGEQSYPILLYAESDFTRLQDFFNTSYPQFEQLNTVYQISADIAQLGLGEFSEQSTIIDIQQIVKRSGIDSSTVQNALDLLTQFDSVHSEAVSDKVLMLKFNWSFATIDDYIRQTSNTEKKEFLETLMRSFPLSAEYQFEEAELSYITGRLRKTAQVVKKGLYLLQQEGVLEFKNFDKQLLIRFLDARSAKVPINKKEYEAYRDVQFEKLKQVENYCKTSDCRNSFFSAYFGEVLKNYRCEVCDNCLKTKSH